MRPPARKWSLMSAHLFDFVTSVITLNNSNWRASGTCTHMGSDQQSHDSAHWIAKEHAISGHLGTSYAY